MLPRNTSMKVSTRLFIAFGGAAVMLVAIAAVAALQIERMATGTCTPGSLTAQEDVRLVLWMAVVGVAGGVLVATWLMRSLSHDLGAEPRELVAHARRVAYGDLAPAAFVSQRGVSADLERMREQLVALVSTVQARAQAVTATSTSLVSGGLEIGRCTESHAAELRFTAECMTALASSVRDSASRAQRAGVQADLARETARAGETEIERVAGAMQAIVVGARRIDDIANLIDGLSVQTSVLALNAAAASVRAGAAGREFGVVAHEVRALSQRSAEAAAEVKTLIASSAEQARRGDAQVRRAGDTMAQLVAIVAAVAANTEDIGRDHEAQGHEVVRLSEALSGLDVRLRESVSLAASNAASAQALGVQATALLQAISAFRLVRQPEG